MICRLAVASAALVLSCLPSTASAEQVASLRVSTLPLGQQLLVRTVEREYRIQIVNSKTGEAQVSGSLDGKLFSPPDKMFIVGAAGGEQTDAGSFGIVLMDEIHEDMRIEWGRGSLDPKDRGETSVVRSIELIPKGS